MRWFSFLVVCEWFDLHSLVSCFYCFGTQIASVCTCLCKMCRNISELLAQRVQLVDGAGSLFMQRPLFTVCVMSGAVSRLQTRHGKDSEAPSNAAFVWMGGRFSVWRLDPDQTNPPVTHQVPGSSVIPAEADSAKKKEDLMVPLWSRCVIPGMKKAGFYTWRGIFWVTHRAACQQSGMRQTYTIFKKILKVICCCGQKSVSLAPQRHTEEGGMLIEIRGLSVRFPKALELFPKKNCDTRAAKPWFMSSTSRVQTGHLIAVVISRGRAGAVTFVRQPEGLD